MLGVNLSKETRVDGVTRQLVAKIGIGSASHLVTNMFLVRALYSSMAYVFVFL